MTGVKGKRSFSYFLAGMLLALVAAQSAPGQAAAPAAPAGEAKPGGSALPERPLAEKSGVRPAHRFWDRENSWLFAGVGASRALDYLSTRNMRRRGVREIFLTDPIVDNHAAFAAIEAAGAAASLGAAYFFHRSGHHRLERWTSRIHIGVATGGAIRNYALPSAHPPP